MQGVKLWLCQCESEKEKKCERDKVRSSNQQQQSLVIATASSLIHQCNSWHLMQYTRQTMQKKFREKLPNATIIKWRSVPESLDHLVSKICFLPDLNNSDLQKSRRADECLVKRSSMLLASRNLNGTIQSCSWRESHQGVVSELNWVHEWSDLKPASV